MQTETNGDYNGSYFLCIEREINANYKLPYFLIGKTETNGDYNHHYFLIVWRENNTAYNLAYFLSAARQITPSNAHAYVIEEKSSRYAVGLIYVYAR